MKSSPHGLFKLGYTCITMLKTNSFFFEKNKEF